MMMIKNVFFSTKVMPFYLVLFFKTYLYIEKNMRNIGINEKKHSSTISTPMALVFPQPAVFHGLSNSIIQLLLRNL